MNQHYVPKCYLKNFAKSKNEEFYVDVYDQIDKKFFNTNTRNICSKKHLYTLDEDQEVASDTLAMEKMYSDHFEPMFIKSYNLLVDDKFETMNGLQRAEITLGLFHLYMRNPHFIYRALKHHRKNILELDISAKTKGEKGLTYLDEDFSFREWDAETIIKYFTDKILKAYREKHVYGIKEMSERHIYAAIEVTKIIDDSRFITCDRPFCMENKLVNDDSPLQRSQEFTITLNPKYAVRIYHDIKVPWQKILRKEVPSGNAGLINSRVQKHSARFLIGDRTSIESHFELEEFMNDTSLELKIDIMKQVLTKYPETSDNREMKALIQSYLDKFEKQGTLSKKEIYVMSLKMKEINRKAVMVKIG